MKQRDAGQYCGKLGVSRYTVSVCLSHTQNYLPHQFLPRPLYDFTVSHGGRKLHEANPGELQSACLGKHMGIKVYNSLPPEIKELSHNVKKV
jgi:hypothetical protein